MPFDTLGERIERQEDELLQALSGLTALTETLNKIDIDSDCAKTPGGPSLAPEWWSPYYQKSLISAVAALTKHTNSSFEKFQSLLREQKEAKQ